MTFFRHSRSPGPPCDNMEHLLNQVADGSVRGFAKWYTLAHVANCSHCGTYLATLRDMVRALRGIEKEGPDAAVMARLQQRVQEARADAEL